jgi:hypothetical protein
MEDRAHAQFRSTTTTATVAIVCFGFVPVHVRALIDTRGTNPNQLEWFNRARFGLWQAGADDAILTTGSTGVMTVDTASISTYAGGDVVTSTDVTNRKYFDTQGNVLVAGTIAPAGISIPAGDQVADGYNFIIADRDNRE